MDKISKQLLRPGFLNLSPRDHGAVLQGPPVEAFAKYSTVLLNVTNKITNVNALKAKLRIFIDEQGAANVESLEGK